MLYIICAVLCGGLVALDQWVKWWTVAKIPYCIPMEDPRPFIPYILGLNYTRNTGAGNYADQFLGFDAASRPGL